MSAEDMLDGRILPKGYIVWMYLAPINPVGGQTYLLW